MAGTTRGRPRRAGDDRNRVRWEDYFPPADPEEIINIPEEPGEAPYPEFETIREWVDKGIADKKTHLVIVQPEDGGAYAPLYLVWEGSAEVPYSNINDERRYKVEEEYLTAQECKDRGVSNKKLIGTNLFTHEIYCLRADSKVDINKQLMEWRAFFFE